MSSRYVTSEREVIEIGCLESFPCQHDIRVNGERVSMTTNDVRNWFLKRNLTVPREFNWYFEHVRQNAEQQEHNNKGFFARLWENLRK